MHKSGICDKKTAISLKRSSLELKLQSVHRDSCRPPQYSSHVHCGQTTGWIMRALGTEVGLGPGHIVLDGDPTPLSKKGAEPPPQFSAQFLLWPNGWMHQDTTWHGVGLNPGDFVLDGGPAPSPKMGRSPQFSVHVYCGQTAGWIKMALGIHCARWGQSSTSKKGAEPPNLQPISIVAKWLDASRCHLVGLSQATLC